jgi:hypothetical protein
MIINIHYHIETGEIASFDTGGAAESYRDELSVIRVDFNDDIGLLKAGHLKVVNNALVEKSDAEIVDHLLPTDNDLRSAILYELNATDGYVDPPSDRPLKGPFLLDWKPYRQALRDLSKLKGPAEMVRAWPLRPAPPGQVGEDAITTLRLRVPVKG